MAEVIPIRSMHRAEEGDWGCCSSCAWAGTDACDECEDAHLFEPATEEALAA